MLVLENVVKEFGTLRAVDNLSFTVKPGEIFGLLGVNGAGKTTTFRMILNLLEPTSGSITYKGKQYDYQLSEEIGFLTEERSLLTKMTVKDQIIYYGRLKGMAHYEILERLDYWLKRFNIENYKNKTIKELSKGNQQKIQFISAIINEPKLLILDEPFSGLDPFNVELFKEIILEFKEKGSTVIFSSHRMEHVELFCEKVMILLNGKPVIEGYINKIKDDFQRKNIFVDGNIDIDKINAIPGVLEVKQHISEYEVKIESDQIVSKVFDYIKTCSNITKFVVERPSLNEIFIEKVGESYNG